ncbi:hypothetical protein ACQZV8_01230 [Magnetococcales bacterium HHB-1]
MAEKKMNKDIHKEDKRTLKDYYKIFGMPKDAISSDIQHVPANIPNQETLAAMRDAKKGENLTEWQSSDDLFKSID